MIPLEETGLYKLVEENVKVKVNLDGDSRKTLSQLMVDVRFGNLYSFPTDDLNNPTLMKDHTKLLTEDLIYTILDQCGITREDIKLLEFCKEFMGKDYHDYIPAYRGHGMGSCDSRHEESSGVVGEE